MRQTLDILVFGPRSAIFIPASRVTERIKYTMVFVMVQKDNDESPKHNMPFVDSETGSGRFQCLPLHLHLHHSKTLISSHLERCGMIKRDYSAVPPQRQASRSQTDTPSQHISSELERENKKSGDRQQVKSKFNDKPELGTSTSTESKGKEISLSSQKLKIEYDYFLQATAARDHLIYICIRKETGQMVAHYFAS